MHELAHAEMHNHKKMQTKNPELQATNVIEYQAEMTAYVVSNYIGIDSEEYSKSYLANWTRKEVDNDIYIQSLNEVKDVSFGMVDNIIEKYQHLNQEQSVHQDEEIAEKLNFLTDSKGHNHYPKLKEAVLKCKTIVKVNSGKSFVDYSVELEDPAENNFQYRIRTEKTKTEIKQKWTKNLTGENWLNQDIKTEVLRRKPQLNVDNPIESKPENAQPFKDFVQEQSAPQPKL